MVESDAKEASPGGCAAADLITTLKIYVIQAGRLVADLVANSQTPFKDCVPSPFPDKAA